MHRRRHCCVSPTLTAAANLPSPCPPHLSPIRPETLDSSSSLDEPLPCEAVTMGSRMQEHDGASLAKIFIGGLPKDTTLEAFVKHFKEHGEIVDSVIMKDWYTNKPRGSGFITYKDASVVDKVTEESDVFNG